MNAFYAIILDRHLDSESPTLELIDSGSSEETLEPIGECDPASDVSRVVRSKFSVSSLDAHPMRNCHTRNANPAHICRLAAS